MSGSSEGPRRATVSAPANIAFVKYWGARDLERALPWHPSISMTLEACRSVTTVEARAGLARDEVWLAGEDGRLEAAAEGFARRVRGHLEAIRTRTGRAERFRVATRNTFPAAAGLASSATGFAALAVATARALDIEDDPRERSVLARFSGSGSAARSVLGGYVEWPSDPRDAESPAAQIAPASHWDLRCVVALLETGPKDVSSLDGHRRAPTSPHYSRRLELVPERLAAARRAIQDRDLPALGPLLEREAIELHTVAMTSEPPIFYWRPATLDVLAAVRGLRARGVAAWSTMDAGANVHVICPPEDEPRVAAALEAVPGIQGLIRDRVGDGPWEEDVDLFGGGEG
ncbi:MAG TPA: diphosphomevalonate decarboxylase [Thermoanaerobaculia bacterium]|nr:diphosphomevalonate decarboxylase [Thermoanaerobaculia bacterium]